MRMTRFIVTTALAVSGLVALARGEIRPAAAEQTANQEKATRLSKFDRKFLTQAAHTGNAEVELSQLALSQATSDPVKKYAQRLIDDHTRANNKLSELANRKGVTLPAEMDDKHKGLRKQLQAQSQQAFDQQYLRTMEQDHARAVTLFEQASKKARDSDIKQFASETLPVLRNHLQEARTLMASQGTGTKTPASPTPPGSPQAPEPPGATRP